MALYSSPTLGEGIISITRFSERVKRGATGPFYYMSFGSTGRYLTCMKATIVSQLFVCTIFVSFLVLPSGVAKAAGQLGVGSDVIGAGSVELWLMALSMLAFLMALPPLHGARRENHLHHDVHLERNASLLFHGSWFATFAAMALGCLLVSRTIGAAVVLDVSVMLTGLAALGEGYILYSLGRDTESK